MKQDVSLCRLCHLPKQKKHRRKPKTGNWNSFCSLQVPEPEQEKAPGAVNTQGEELGFCKCFDHHGEQSRTSV